MSDPADLTDLECEGARRAPDLLDQALDLCRRVVERPIRELGEQDRLFAELDRLIVGDARLPDRLLESPCFCALHDSLLHVRAAYEYERECALARAIVAAGDPSPVARFRSVDMYRKTYAFESKALAPFDPQRILFVGCGPFPLTAIAWPQEFPNAAVTCLERLEEGYGLAREVAAVFGCADLDIRCTDGLSVTDFEPYDVVHVGTVVGISAAEKAAVTDHFVRRVPRSTLLVFRTAVGPGRVIYPRIDPECLGGLPTDLDVSVPTAWLLSVESGHLLNFVDSWIEVHRDLGLVERSRRYWIMGKGDESHQAPRWSVIRELLHWID